MIEAMACGTPVLAFPNGAVPEIMQDFPNLICSSVDEMVQKINLNKFPHSKSLRKYVSQHFTTDHMTKSYINLYNKLLTEKINYSYGNKLNIYDQRCFDDYN